MCCPFRQSLQTMVLISEPFGDVEAVWEVSGFPLPVPRFHGDMLHGDMLRGNGDLPGLNRIFIYHRL